MKKIVVMLLALCLMLGMAACGGQEAPAAEEVKIEAVPKVEAEAAPAVTPTEAATEAPTEAVVEETAADLKALAESCIDKDISELYALIGEPASSEYAPSCLVEGEDGALYYDGFVVYTTREGEVETVYYVE